MENIPPDGFFRVLKKMPHRFFTSILPCEFSYRKYVAPLGAYRGSQLVEQKAIQKETQPIAEEPLLATLKKTTKIKKRDIVNAATACNVPSFVT